MSENPIVSRASKCLADDRDARIEATHAINNLVRSLWGLEPARDGEHAGKQLHEDHVSWALVAQRPDRERHTHEDGKVCRTTDELYLSNLGNIAMLHGALTKAAHTLFTKHRGEIIDSYLGEDDEAEDRAVEALADDLVKSLLGLVERSVSEAEAEAIERTMGKLHDLLDGSGVTVEYVTDHPDSKGQPGFVFTGNLAEALSEENFVKVLEAISGDFTPSGALFVGEGRGGESADAGLASDSTD